MHPQKRKHGDASSLAGEDRIVEMLSCRFGARTPRLRKGIGDDAAIIRIPGAREDWVVTTDMLVEDVDFRLDWQSPAQLGWKSLAVNLSDLAAMGAQPRFYTVSLALPDDIRSPWITNFYKGMHSIATNHDVSLIGGDLSSSPRGIQISITAIGETIGRKALYRSKGCPGDPIYVSGVLGKSAAGLALLQKGCKRGRTRSEREALAAHRTPEPRCKIGRWLLRHGLARAMMDISDGLSLDLSRLCLASGTGALVFLDRLPVFAESSEWGCDSRALALHGGEDFELLFCVPTHKTARLEGTWPRGFPRPSRIGLLTRTPGVLQAENHAAKPFALPRRGYDHFAHATFED